jgi:polyhydroxyalkanoate synthesis regulator phasin
LVEQGQSVIDALSTGDISPGEAVTVMQSIASQARIIEVDDLEKRVSELEERNA